MDFQSELEKLQKSLKETQVKKPNLLEQSNCCIILCRNLLGKFKKHILKNGFASKPLEIQFFKYIKQIPLRDLIYYSEVRSFELQFPKADVDAQNKYIHKKLKKLNRFYLYNIDFVQYIESQSSHFDEQYYTRNAMDTYQIFSSKFYFQDPDFFTPRDMLLGKYHAFNNLIIYLNKRKLSLLTPGNYGTIKDENSKLHWPFSNTDYVELLYALYHKGIGSENDLSIMSVSQILQDTFDFEPKDIYKTYQDIKNRKISRTSFLDRLSTSLLTEMDKSDL